jgi:hypothetical protein
MRFHDFHLQRFQLVTLQTPTLAGWELSLGARRGVGDIIVALRQFHWLPLACV